MSAIRQEINLNEAQNTISNTQRSIEQLDTTKYDGSVTYIFEVVMNKTGAGTDTVTLRRNGTTTDDATLTFTGTPGNVRQRTTFTPPTGQTEYFENIAGVSIGKPRSARIIVLQSGTITKTETQIEIGSIDTGNTNTTAAPLDFPKYWYYDSSKWDGTISFFAEVSSLISSSMQNYTIKLQEDDGSFGTWTDKVTIVNAGTNTTAARTRSASFSPTTGRNYRITGVISSSAQTYDIYSAKIIIQQSNTPTKMELQYLLLNTNSTTTGVSGHNTLYDPTEWSGNTLVFIHEGNSVSGGTSDLQVDVVGGSQVTGSGIVDCIEREQSSSMTMPASNDLDTNITSAPSTVNSSRILVQVSPLATGAPPPWPVLSFSKFFSPRYS